MSVTFGLTRLALLGLCVLSSGAASATCASHQMREPAAGIFSSAETKFFSGAPSFEVMMTLSPMKNMELTCFEAGRMHLLIAGVHMKDKDNRSAAESFEAALREDFLDKSARRDVLKALGNLYLKFDEVRASATFENWIQIGGRPSVDEELTIASLHLNAGRLDKAFTHAENAYRESTSADEKTRADTIMTEAQKRRLGQ